MSAYPSHDANPPRAVAPCRQCGLRIPEGEQLAVEVRVPFAAPVGRSKIIKSGWLCSHQCAVKWLETSKREVRAYGVTV